MSFKATAEAPANLAFVKYWGKKDAGLRLPTNNSISVNLSQAKTFTSVEFDENLGKDTLSVLGREPPLEREFSERVFQHLERVRTMAGVKYCAEVRTRNSFPAGVGIASSASGFAALTVAACAALDLNLSEKELSALARLGSGSACRSIPDGFTEWIATDKDNLSYAVQIASPDHWDIQIITVVVSKQSKLLSSTSGHALATASPFFAARLEGLERRLETVRSAINQRDFETFGRETEMEAISFHTIAMTSPIESQKSWQSGAYYWLPESLELMLEVQRWRGDGIEVFFTLDAGPTVHLICQKKDLTRVVSAIHEIESRKTDRKWELLVNSPSVGAHVIEEIIP
jgi:diphosphomevalonate decarboxylase